MFLCWGLNGEVPCGSEQGCVKDVGVGLMLECLFGVCW